ncbi:MAG: TlpA family protein disulfide reductase [Deltaproteobacteria bacterium]|nr:TlpA family protein disulfide reductase [Deltaproteobacteria bacterium]MBI4796077.1 TlpA family protein disulfide reductase [Deltaproteobacteria bacterium]
MPSKFKRGFRHIFQGLVLVACILAFAAGSLAANKAAPDFSLPDILQGKNYSLSQYKGKVVMINFFTFFCMPCREEMPDLNNIYKEMQGKGLQVLGIGLSSDPVQLRFLVKQIGLTYPVLAGNDKVSKDYGNVEVVPTTFIIDKQGNIAHKILGTRKKEEFVKMIQALL